MERRDVSPVPFDSKHPSVVLHAEMVKIAWGTENGYEDVCRRTPESRTPLGEAEHIELYPYGCAKLRMTEMPLV